MNRVDCLIGQLLPLRRAARHLLTQNNLTTMAKIVGVVGRLNAEMAAVAVEDLVVLCQKSSIENLPILLKEIEGNFFNYFYFILKSKNNLKFIN